MKRWLLALLPLAMLSGVAPAQTPRPNRVPAQVLKNQVARKLLRRMVQAELNQPFIAREVFAGTNGRTVEQWVKQDPKRGVRRETIQPPGELVLDNRKRQFLLSQRDKRFVESKSHFAETQKRLQEVLRVSASTFSIELQGQDTIAGRSVDIVLVHPLAQNEGPSRRFWIDRESGLRLRTEERDAAGRIISNAYFLSVELNPAFRDEDFLPPAIPAGMRRIVDNQKHFKTAEQALRQGVNLKLPGWLPSGFTLRTISTTNEGKGPVTIHWGNELTVLTLVSAQNPPPPMLLKQLAGADSGFIQLPRGDRAYVRKTSEGYAMLIGNLPDEQLKHIADSVK